MAAPTKPDYGIDAPGVVRNLFLASLPCRPHRPVTFIIRPVAGTRAASLAAGGLLMILHAKWGKFRHRDRMLAMIPWKGDETVLDVGTGRGLLMIGAAKRLSTGQALGIDIWSAKDLSGNCPD